MKVNRVGAAIGVFACLAGVLALVACGGGNGSAGAGPSSTATSALAPGPAALANDSSTANSVAFHWSRPPSDAKPDRYLIVREGKKVGGVPATRTSYKDTGLTPATVYHYRVIAVWGDQRSAPSSTLKVKTLGKAFTKGKVVRVPGVSTMVGQGTISFSASKKAGQIIFGISGTVAARQVIKNGSVQDAYMCMLCMPDVQIDAGLAVPVGTPPFFTESRTSTTLTQNSYDVTLEGPIPKKAKYFIQAGPDGAKLQKVGSGFKLVSGAAYLVEKTAP